MFLLTLYLAQNAGLWIFETNVRMFSSNNFYEFLFWTANQKAVDPSANRKARIEIKTDLGRKTGNVSTQNINTETNIKIVLK